MEYLWYIICPLIGIKIIFWLMDCTFTSAENNNELRNNAYFISNTNEQKQIYKGNENFKVKIIKIENKNRKCTSEVHFIIGFKEMPPKYTRLKITQLDKNENVINFKETFIETEQLKYSIYENQTLFNEYDKNTIPKFYTVTQDIFIDDCDRTEYFVYNIY